MGAYDHRLGTVRRTRHIDTANLASSVGHVQ